MWKGKAGPCTCFFCVNGKEHPASHSDPKWGEWGSRGHLQVAESLDPADIVHTRVCPLCTHEVRAEEVQP